MKDNLNSKESSPLVTVYMPTYNRVELLQRAVESVLNQDYQNIELIVVDDKSTDSTHEYLEKIAKEDSRFKYFINEENSGACVSRNKAIFAAKGEFITGLDDDDYFLSHHISTFVRTWGLRKDNFIALYPNAYTVRKNKPLKSPQRVRHCKASELISYNWIGNQIFTKASYLKEIKGFDERFPAWQDLECWYRLLKTYDSYAYSTKIYSYVIDISHPHERISTGNINKVLKAYNLFCKKYYLSNNEKYILELQLNPYLGESSKLIGILRSLEYVPSKANFILSIKRAVKPFFVKNKKV